MDSKQVMEQGNKHHSRQGRPTALVLGASGGIGGEVARQLRDAGWDVRALKRGLDSAAETKDGITWFRGDALNADDVMASAAGCSVIVHAVNPPGYHQWEKLVLPMLDNTLAAARAQRATVVLPGTVYNFGPDVLDEVARTATPVAEDVPQRPTTKKGGLRVEMERRLQAATTQGVRAIIVRAGDFFGARAANNWFGQGLVKPGQAVKTISTPGQAGLGHQWAYLPDVARTMVALLQRRDTLPAFARFHMDGHWDADGTQMAQAIQRVVARRTGATPQVKALPWWLLMLASPFVTTLREMREMRYLWQVPLRMDNRRLVATLGAEPHTPLDAAVEAALQGLGCFGEPVAAPAVAAA